MKPGDRVKCSSKAFENGVCDRTETSRARRGTVGHQVRTFPNPWTVKWDGRKTPDKIAAVFLTVVKD